ncbi:MAG: hypothetical protein HY725_20270 [Candidatus Rokubacteria bacterium]|nr:hypothetical protein [Candidatus Rokubacteria bacterium]
MAPGERLGPRARPAAAIALAVLLTVAAAARGESPAPPEPASEGPTLAELGIKGRATFKNFSHFYETPNDDRKFRNEGILEVEWGRRLLPWSRVKVVVDIREDDDSLTRGVTLQVPEKNERRSVLNLKEAVAGFQQGAVEVTLGKQIFAWGTADAYNPTDNINPYDYLDVIDNEKLGVYSAAARLTVVPASLTVVVIPFFTPSRIPLLRSRWVPPPPEGVIAIVDNRQLPPRDVDNMQYAARLKTTFGGVDLSASYYEGFEPTPVIRRSAVRPAPDLAPDLVLPRFTPVFTRMKVAGLDVSTTYGKFEVHGEGAFKFVEQNGRDDRVQWIAGLNYTWDDLDLKWLEQVTAIAEYARETVLSSDPRSPIIGGAESPGALLNNAFRNALAGRLLFKFSEETQLKLSGTIDFSQSANHYLQLKLAHKFTDALHAETGLDLFTGAPETFWGRWRDNDRFFFFLRYFF